MRENSILSPSKSTWPLSSNQSTPLSTLSDGGLGGTHGGAVDLEVPAVEQERLGYRWKLDRIELETVTSAGRLEACFE